MRTKKAMKNMIASLLYQIIAIVCGLITPRLILQAFGSEYNGVVLSATQYLSMINLLNIGITGVTRVALYKTLANNDTLGTSRIMKATHQYMRKVALCVILYAAVLCVLYPMFSHNSLTQMQCASLIVIVSIGTFAEYFFGLSNQTLLQAAQSSYIIYILNIIKLIINMICVYVLIGMDCSIYTVKLGSSLIYFIIPFIMHLYVKKKFQITSKCEPDFDAIKQRGSASFHTVSNIIHNNTDLVLLTLFTDAKLISVYTVYYMVVSKVKSLMQVFSSGIEAAFGDIWARREYEVLNRRFRNYEYLIYTFTAIAFSCVAVLIVPFIAIYTQGINDVNYIRIPLALLVVAAETMHCIRQPYLTLVYATGSFEDTKMGALFEAIINICISVVLLIFIGIEGVIIGTLVANIFRTIQFSIYVSKHILNRSIMEVVKRFTWTICLMLVTCLVSTIVLNQFSFEASWFAWFVQACIVLFISLIITCVFSIIFYRSDFNELFKTLLKTIYKKSN